MKITGIEQQKRHSQRYSVYVDGQFWFGISERDLLRLGLRLGQEISHSELEKLQEEATFGKAYDKALGYLDLRPRSCQEIKDYLNRKQFSREATARVVERLQDIGLLDDAQFAQQWVEWRQQTRPRSRRHLMQELKQKGIDDQLIRDALSDIDDNTEITQVRTLIDKHGYRYDSKEKLLAYLSRQGYSYDVIRQAMDEIENASD